MGQSPKVTYRSVHLYTVNILHRGLRYFKREIASETWLHLLLLTAYLPLRFLFYLPLLIFSFCAARNCHLLPVRFSISFPFLSPPSQEARPTVTGRQIRCSVLHILCHV